MSDALPPPRVYRTERMTAEVYDYGAHLTAWTPSGGDPALWLSPLARFEAGTAIRGGVPICFPWFGPGRDGDCAPAHGFARTTTWLLTDESTQDGVVTVDYDLTDAAVDTEGGGAPLPNSFRTSLRIILGSTLELALTVLNTDHAPLEIEEALHTYLAVSDVREVWLDGLDGVEYLDKVHGGRRRQRGAVRFVEETDRVYLSGGPTQLIDPARGRVMTVETDGAADLVVWTPWTDKASAMADVGAQAWTGFICVEAANALSDFVTLAPGESHTMRYRLRVDAIEGD